MTPLQKGAISNAESQRFWLFGISRGALSGCATRVPHPGATRRLSPTVGGGTPPLSISTPRNPEDPRFLTWACYPSMALCVHVGEMIARFVQNINSCPPGGEMTALPPACDWSSSVGSRERQRIKTRCHLMQHIQRKVEIAATEDQPGESDCREYQPPTPDSQRSRRCYCLRHSKPPSVTTLTMSCFTRGCFMTSTLQV